MARPPGHGAGRLCVRVREREHVRVRVCVGGQQCRGRGRGCVVSEPPVDRGWVTQWLPHYFQKIKSQYHLQI